MLYFKDFIVRKKKFLTSHRPILWLVVNLVFAFFYLIGHVSGIFSLSVPFAIKILATVFVIMVLLILNLFWKKDLNFHRIFFFSVFPVNLGLSYLLDEENRIYMLTGSFLATLTLSFIIGRNLHNIHTIYETYIKNGVPIVEDNDENPINATVIAVSLFDPNVVSEPLGKSSLWKNLTSQQISSISVNLGINTFLESQNLHINPVTHSDSDQIATVKNCLANLSTEAECLAAAREDVTFPDSLLIGKNEIYQGITTISAALNAKSLEDCPITGNLWIDSCQTSGSETSDNSTRFINLAQVDAAIDNFPVVDNYSVIDIDIDNYSVIDINQSVGNIPGEFAEDLLNSDSEVEDINNKSEGDSIGNASNPEEESI